MRSIGKFLAGKRLEQGLTQKQVADVCGYSSPQFVSHWERDVALPPPTAVKPLAKMLKLPKPYLTDLVADKVREKFVKGVV